MSFQMPITKRKIKHHFQYSIWKYLLLIALSLFIWNLIYTTTRYQPPEEMRVEFYVQATSSSESLLQPLTEKIHTEALPDMELVTISPVTISDDYYGDMQLTVWISAAQGDIYMIDSDYYKKYASSGAFLDLGPYVENGQLNTDGLDLSAGYRKLTDPDPGFEGSYLYGIPADDLTGFVDYLVNPEDKVLCVLYRNGNDENSIKFLQYLLSNLR